MKPSDPGAMRAYGVTCVVEFLHYVQVNSLMDDPEWMELTAAEKSFRFFQTLRPMDD